MDIEPKLEAENHENSNDSTVTVTVIVKNGQLSMAFIPNIDPTIFVEVIDLDETDPDILHEKELMVSELKRDESMVKEYF